MNKATQANTALSTWVDERCERIAAATGAQRYQQFASAVYALNMGQGKAPIVHWFDENGPQYDAGEVVMTLQALCWAALAAGVKRQTVKRTWEREIQWA